MITALLCSCERHSKLTEEMYSPLRPILKEDSSSFTFYKLATNRNWQSKVLDTGKVTQQNIPRQELGGFFGVFFFFFFVPQLYLWGSPLLGEIFAYVTVF